MKRPSARVRAIILKALDFLQDAEPSDEPNEERRDNADITAAEAWIQGHAPPLEL